MAWWWALLGGIGIVFIILFVFWLGLHYYGPGQMQGLAVMHIEFNLNKTEGQVLQTDDSSAGTTDIIFPDAVLDESGLNIRLGVVSFPKSIGMTIEKHMKEKYDDFAKDDATMPRYFFHGSHATFDTVKPNTIMLTAITNLFETTMYAFMMVLPRRVGLMKPFWWPLLGANKVPSGFRFISDHLAPITEFRGGSTSDGRPITGYVHVMYVQNASFWQGGPAERICEFDAKQDPKAFGPTKAEGGMPPGKICVRKNGSATEWKTTAFHLPTDAAEDAWIMAPDVIQAADLKIIHHYRVVGPRGRRNSDPSSPLLEDAART